MLQIIPLLAFKDNYIWLIRHQDEQSCIIVDPGDATPVIHYLQRYQLSLAAILITHHHQDHSAGIAELLLHSPKALVYGPAHEAIPGVTHRLEDGNTVIIPQLSLHFQVLAIPGHTHGHIAYYGHQLLFCGDTLFAAGCGRLFEGTPAQMLASLTKLATLPDETYMFCGHEYTVNNLKFALLVEPHNAFIQQRLQQAQTLRQQGLPTLPSTLALEKQTNPFLRTQLPLVKQAAERYSGKVLSAEVDVFSVLRGWKDQFKSSDN